MRDYVILVLALVVFVIVFNSILGSKKEKMEFKQIQQKSTNCKDHSAILYYESFNNSICLNKRS